MRLIIDMNLSPRRADWLLCAGHQATHWSTVGSGGAPDGHLLAYAKTHDAVLLTQDLDFGAILAVTGDNRPSVIQVRAEDNSPEAIGPLLLKAIELMATELRAGALITVEPSRNRMRLLPFQR